MKRIIKNKGFTLVELIVVIMMLGTFLVFSLAYINPFSQINKANDGKRLEDIKQIKTALDTYYNDTNCYPASIPYGEIWEESSATYMRKVPQDPECASDPASCYIYTYSGSCPQWGIVFAKLSKTPEDSACVLNSLSNCAPVGFDSTWACQVTGNADCSYLSSVDLGDFVGSESATPTPTVPGSTPTFTPSPTPNNCTPKNYACTGAPLRCNVVSENTGTYCTSNCDGAC